MSGEEFLEFGSKPEEVKTLVWQKRRRFDDSVKRDEIRFADAEPCHLSAKTFDACGPRVRDRGVTRGQLKESQVACLSAVPLDSRQYVVEYDKTVLDLMVGRLGGGVDDTVHEVHATGDDPGAGQQPAPENGSPEAGGNILAEAGNHGSIVGVEWGRCQAPGQATAFPYRPGNGKVLIRPTAPCACRVPRWRGRLCRRATIRCGGSGATRTRWDSTRDRPGNGCLS